MLEVDKKVEEIAIGRIGKVKGVDSIAGRSQSVIVDFEDGNREIKNAEELCLVKSQAEEGPRRFIPRDTIV